MLRNDAQDILCLIDYINDTKPYHSKLSQVELEYQYNEEIVVDISDDLYTKTNMSSIWKYSFLSDGFIKRFRIPDIIQPRSSADQSSENCNQIGITDRIPGTSNSYAVPYNSGVEVTVNGVEYFENVDYILEEERTIVKFNEFTNSRPPVLNDDICFTLYSIDRLFIKIDGNWVHYAVDSTDPLADVSYAFDTSSSILRYEWINQPPLIAYVGAFGLDNFFGYDDTGFDPYGKVDNTNALNNTTIYNGLVATDITDSYGTVPFDSSGFSQISAAPVSSISVIHLDPHMNNSPLTVSAQNVVINVFLSSDVAGNVLTDLTQIVDSINNANSINYTTTVVASADNGYGDAGFDINGYSDFGVIQNLEDILPEVIILAPGVSRIEINYILPLVANTNLLTTIDPTGALDILVSLATDSFGNISSTVNDVIQAVNTHPQAQLSVVASSAGDGTAIAAISNRVGLAAVYPIPSIAYPVIQETPNGIITQFTLSYGPNGADVTVFSDNVQVGYTLDENNILTLQSAPNILEVQYSSRTHINSELTGLAGAYKIPANGGVVAYLNGELLTEGVDYNIEGANNELIQFIGTLPNINDPDIFIVDYIEATMATDENASNYNGTDFNYSTYFPSGIVGKIIKVQENDGEFYTFEFIDELPRGTSIEFCIDQRETHSNWARCQFAEELKFMDVIKKLGNVFDDSDDYAFVTVQDDLQIHVDLQLIDILSITTSEFKDFDIETFELSSVGIVDSIVINQQLFFNDLVNVVLYDVPYGGGYEFNKFGDATGFDTAPWGGVINHSGNPVVNDSANIIQLGSFDGPEGFDNISFDINDNNSKIGSFDGPEGMGYAYDLAGTDDLPINPVTAFDLVGFDDPGYGGNLVRSFIKIIPNFDISVVLSDSTLIDVVSDSQSQYGEDSAADFSSTNIQDSMVMVVDYVDATPTDVYGTVTLDGGGYFEQTTPVTILTVQHNLGYTPAVVITITGIPAAPDTLTHIDNNVLQVQFNALTAFEINVS